MGLISAHEKLLEIEYPYMDSTLGVYRCENDFCEITKGRQLAEKSGKKGSGSHDTAINEYYRGDDIGLKITDKLNSETDEWEHYSTEEWNPSTQHWETIN